MTGQSVSIREADDVVLPTTMPAILRLGKSAGLTKVNLYDSEVWHTGYPDPFRVG